MKKIIPYCAILTLFIIWSAFRSPEQKGWIKLFDGKTLDGWKVGDNAETFKIENGSIVANGNVAHLFYVGSVMNHNFKNFDYKAKVMTTPGSNSGMYIHSQFQDKGFPSIGYEIQVNNSHTDWRRTGSVYGVQDVKETFVKDNEWYTEEIIVQGKKITVKINGKTINEYTEPDNMPGADKPGRRISSGTFALQGHDPKSKVYYKDIMVKPLPD